MFVLRINSMAFGLGGAIFALPFERRETNMGIRDGFVFQAIAANNRSGRLIRTSGAIATIVGCSYFIGMIILGPMLADAANIKPGAVFAVQPSSDNSVDNKIETNATALKLSSKSDPDMIISPVAKISKITHHKRKLESHIRSIAIEAPKEKKIVVPPPPVSDPDQIQPDKAPQKPDNNGDGDTGKIDN